MELAIEEGGEWFEARVELEGIAKAIQADHFKVSVNQQGPFCTLSKSHINATLYLAEDDKYLIEKDGSSHHLVFYKEDAIPDLWSRL